jgi:DNA (cytosine-5)-methyltransferase 1
MARPVLLDLFCGGGGAAMGYHRAGFDVIGVDIVRQPDYPFPFVLADALTYGPLSAFDAIHASPPCKRYTTVGGADRRRPRLFDPHPDCLGPMLARLELESVPWVVENVPGAPMPPGAVVYCGSSFGLDVRRHRLFASNRPLVAPPCNHGWQTPRFTSLDLHRHKGGRMASVVGVYGHAHGDGDTLALRQRAMGIDWLANDRLTQAIPPAYTEHVGRQLLAAL